MKTKKGFKVSGVMVLCVATVMALQSMGTTSVVSEDTDGGWYTCTVAQANAGTAHSYIKLTNLSGNPHFALKWFMLPKKQETEMTVTASKAIRNGRTVDVKADIHNGILPEIEAMHLTGTRTPSEEQDGGFFRACQTLRAKACAIL